MRVFLRKPKWIAYVLLFIILAQFLPQFLRYHFANDDWKDVRSKDYGYGLSYPANWVLEQYHGKYRSYDDIVAIIGDTNGIAPARSLIMVFWRRSDTPNLENTADWGQATIKQIGGFDISGLEETFIGTNNLPALRQSFHYDKGYEGFTFYAVGNNAEYIFFFGSKAEETDIAGEFKKILSSIILFD